MTDRQQDVKRRGKKSFRMLASSFDGRDFSNMDLSGADFSFSSLHGVNFNGSDLKNAVFRFSALDNATFRDADLTGADLSFSSLTDVDFTGAKVEGANFSFSGQSRYCRKSEMSLIGIIQSQTWLGTLVAVVLGAVMLYGFSAISYFTAEISLTADPLTIEVNQYLIIQNIVFGICVVLMTQWISVPLDHWIKNVFLRHLFLSVFIIAFSLLVNYLLFLMAGEQIFQRVHEQFPDEVALKIPFYWYLYGPVIVANFFYYLGGQGRQLSRKISEQEYQLLNLEKLKTTAELDALQARVNPHFLYNSLNSVASLVHDDPEKAEEMILLLSKLFRYTTGRKNSDYFDSIAHELEMVQTYLQVEKVRFGSRLQFNVEVVNADLNELPVPKFILQPIVENAIKHGIARLAEQGCIRVSIFEREGWLQLCVHDNGPPFPETMEAGYGIRSIQDKLKLLYGDDARLELKNEPFKSVNIHIRKSAIQSKAEV